MKQSLGMVAIVVRDYDEAIDFYVGTCKRWVVVTPRGATGSRLPLARAVGQEQASHIGNQTVGRVFLFLYTDDFWRDYRAYKEKAFDSCAIRRKRAMAR